MSASFSRLLERINKTYARSHMQIDIFVVCVVIAIGLLCGILGSEGVIEKSVIDGAFVTVFVILGIAGFLWQIIATFYYFRHPRSERERSFMIKQYVFLWGIALPVLLVGALVLSEPFDVIVYISFIWLFLFYPSIRERKLMRIRKEESAEQP